MVREQSEEGDQVRNQWLLTTSTVGKATLKKRNRRSGHILRKLFKNVEFNFSPNSSILGWIKSLLAAGSYMFEWVGKTVELVTGGGI